METEAVHMYMTLHAHTYWLEHIYARMRMLLCLHAGAFMYLLTSNSHSCHYCGYASICSSWSCLKDTITCDRCCMHALILLIIIIIRNWFLQTIITVLV